MDDQPFFQNSIRLKYEDVLTANQMVGRHIRAGLLFKLTRLVITIVVIFGFIELAPALADMVQPFFGRDGSHLVILLAYGLVFAGMFFVLRFLLVFHYVRIGARNLRKIRPEDTESYRIGEQGIETDGAGTFIRTSWHSIVSLIERPKYVGFSVGSYEIVIPDRAFADSEEREKVVAYALAHMTEDAAKRSIRKR